MNRLIAVLATAMLAVPAGAAAPDPFVAAEVAVRYTDLDLARPADRVRLDTRLANAAADVCGRGFDRVHPMLAQQAALCKAEVIADTRARIEQTLAAKAGPARVAGTVATAATLK